MTRRRRQLPRHPTALERAYERLLLKRNHAIQDLLRRKMAPILAAANKREGEREEEREARTDAIDGDGIARLIQVVDLVAAAVNEKFPLGQLDLFAIARGVDRFNAGQQAAAATRDDRKVFTVDVFAPYQKNQGPMPGWLEKNVGLIKTIDERFFADIRTMVSDAATSGTTTQDLADDIQRRYDVSDSRARLIGRDQVAKLNGQITEARQAEIGVIEYIWSDSGDERVRPMHKELNNTVQKWAEPPIVSKDGRREHPGGDYQDRCQALPILPGETADDVRALYGEALTKYADAA